MSIFSFLATLFADLFNATRRAWDHLPKTVQTGIINGSGVFSILSQYIGQDPKLTIATIQENYPIEDLNVLYTGLSTVAKTYGLTVPATLEDLIVVIQTHLKSLDNNEWARILSGAAQILGDIFTGSGTPFEVIVTVIQWAYTNLVKPAPVKFADIPASITLAPPVANIPVDNAATNESETTTT